jgi:hypothetical protein
MLPGCPFQEPIGARDHRAVPAGSVLVLEQDDTATGIEAGAVQSD